MSTPEVVVYVRHSDTCLDRERPESWRGCNCWKHLRIKHADGTRDRQAVKTRSWAEAEQEAARVRQELLLQHAQAQTPVPTANPGAPAQGQGLVTIQQAIDAFVVSQESDGVSDGVVKKYKRELGRLAKFCDKQGRYTLSQVTRLDLDIFRASWAKEYPSKVTRSKVQERLKAFFRYAHNAHYVAENMAAHIKAIQIKESDRTPAMPFTEVELRKMLGSVPQVAETPEEIARTTLMIKFMAATGTAIHDTMRLERSNIQQRDGDMWLSIFRQKTGKLAEQRLDASLAQELVAQPNGNREYIFWRAVRRGKLSSAVNNWRDYILRPLMKKAGCYAEGNVAHRFRDTAVDYWASKGASVSDIAAMLGDSEAIIERHYKTILGRILAKLAQVPVRKWEEAQGAAGGD